MALDYEEAKLRLKNDQDFYRSFCDAKDNVLKRNAIYSALSRLFTEEERGCSLGMTSLKVFRMCDELTMIWHLRSRRITASDQMVTQPPEDALSKWLPENDMSVEISKLLDNGVFVHNWRVRTEGNFDKTSSNMRDFVCGWLPAHGVYSSAELDQVVYTCIKSITTIPLNQIEGIPMSHPNIEVKTFISGIDSKDVSDDAIFNKIANLENEITQLDKTAAKPKKLIAKIEALQADIAALVAFVDAR